MVTVSQELLAHKRFIAHTFMGLSRIYVTVYATYDVNIICKHISKQRAEKHEKEETCQTMYDQKLPKNIQMLCSRPGLSRLCMFLIETLVGKYTTFF